MDLDDMGLGEDQFICNELLQMLLNLYLCLWEEVPQFKVAFWHAKKEALSKIELRKAFWFDDSKIKFNDQTGVS